jgi:signal peptide peptidase SppA
MVIGSHLLNSLSEDAWFVLPSTLKAYENILNSKFVDKFKFESIPSEAGNNIASNPLKIENGKAVLSMSGTLVRKAGYLDAMCGMTGMDTLSKLFTHAMNDDSVEHMVLEWDSPGGSAIGTPEFAEIVYSMRDRKRITSLVSGQMCSAAYYIGSAAHEIYSSSAINSVGSIGVVMQHIDQSGADSAEGLKYTYIYAGKHKVDGNPHESLSPEAHGRMQKSADYLYGIFLDSVSKFRGADVSAYAEGQVFNAGQLIGTPMIDGIATLDEILRS